MMSVLPFLSGQATPPAKNLKTATKFFEFEKLGPEEKTRVPAAIEKFHKVQKANIAKTLDALRAEGKYTPQDAEAITVRFKSYKPDEYSKLFHRILMGEDALDAPPPKAFGYPSYEMVDEQFSLIAEFGGISALEKKIFLVICGERWELVWRNKLARQLMGFESKFRPASNRPASPKWDTELDDQKVKDSGYMKNPRELLLALFTMGKPRFIVKDPNWGYYELVVNRAVMVGDLEEDLETIERIKRQDGGLLQSVSFADVRTNLKVTNEVVDGITGIKWITFEMDAWHLSRVPGWSLETEEEEGTVANAP